MTKTECRRCGQPLDIHNAEYCEAVLKVWGEPAKHNGSSYPQSPTADLNKKQGVR